MAYKKFANTRATALSSPMTASDTTLIVTDGSTYPDPASGGNGPYTLLVGYGSDREEVVTVTAKPNANTFTVTRGEDGSSATAKNVGDVVVHGVSKRDWEDIQTQVASQAAQIATKAPLASPALTGAPTAPTAAPGTSTTQLATTAFVTAADILKAPLASPAFTGNPTAPTPAAGDNDTSISTTAFVTKAVSDHEAKADPHPQYATDVDLTGKANAVHVHDYAATTHTHDYSPSGHTHGDYAPAGHGHDYSPSNHVHNYAPSGHVHALERRILSRASGNTSIANNSATLLTGGWSAETGDGGNNAPFTYSGGVITVSEAMFVGIGLYAAWAANGTGERRAEIVTSVGTWRDNIASPGSGGGAMHQILIPLLYLPAGATIQCQVLQTSGAALDLATQSRWMVWKVAGP